MKTWVPQLQPDAAKAMSIQNVGDHVLRVGGPEGICAAQGEQLDAKGHHGA